MAANFLQITRRPLVSYNGTELVLPGNQRRRVLSFHLPLNGGSASLDVQAGVTDNTALFLVQTDPWYLRIDYKDWGELVCQPWYCTTTGVPIVLTTVETFLLDRS